MDCRFRIMLILAFGFDILMYFSLAAQILAVFPIRSRSHHSINQPIVKGLAAKGHNVTMISNFKTDHCLQNYTELLLEENTHSFIDSISLDMVGQWKGITEVMRQGFEVESNVCLILLKHEYIQKILKTQEKVVDLILAEGYDTQCYNLLAEKLDVPIVYVEPPSSSPGVGIMSGRDRNPSYIPMITTPYTNKMGFRERLVNFMHYSFQYFGYYTFLNYYMKGIAKEFFNMELPSFEQLHKRAALLLINNHFSLIGTSKPPNVIEIAGIHIKEPKPLPKDIRKFIDEAEQGVIFFTFGTTINATSISEEKFNIFKNVFAKIPQRVLWRIEHPRLHDLSSNVRTSQWFPQRDILEHKNVKAFISHCGLFGSLESIHTATPVIGIPFIFDQEQNGNLLAEKGMAIVLDYFTLTEEKFIMAIDEVINNTKYAKNAQIASSIFRDRIVSPLDEALYWIEYVIRHKGATILKTTATNLPFYQYFLLDVIFIIMVGICVIILAMKIIFRRMINLFFKHKNAKYKQC